MKTNRRNFISTAITGSLAATLPFSACRSADSKLLSSANKPDYSKLDEILKKPIFKKEYFTSPVIIDTLNYFDYKKFFMQSEIKRRCRRYFGRTQWSAKITISYFH